MILTDEEIRAAWAKAMGVAGAHSVAIGRAIEAAVLAKLQQGVELFPSSPKGTV